MSEIKKKPVGISQRCPSVTDCHTNDDRADAADYRQDGSGWLPFCRMLGRSHF